MNVIVLNADYSFINTVSWKKALILLEKGKVEVLKKSDKIINTCNKKIFIPLIIRLIKLIRIIYKAKVPFSKRNILIRDNFTCVYCGDKEKLNIDHIVPRSKGGKTSWENCVASCYKCNHTKGDFLPSEIKMYSRTRPVQPTISQFLNIKMKNMGIDVVISDFFVE